MIKILVYSAPWCGPCRQMEPTVELINKKYPGLIQKINVDKDAEMSIKHGIRSIPTIVVLKGDTDRDFKEIDRLIGGQPKAKLLEFFNNYGKQ